MDPACERRLSSDFTRNQREVAEISVFSWENSDISPLFRQLLLCFPGIRSQMICARGPNLNMKSKNKTKLHNRQKPGRQGTLSRETCLHAQLLLCEGLLLGFAGSGVNQWPPAALGWSPAAPSWSPASWASFSRRAGGTWRQWLSKRSPVLFKRHGL